MKKTATSIMCLALLVISLFQMSCKKTEDTVIYILTVTVAAGVSGTPTANIYEYNAGVNVPYTYTLKEGYKDLVVKLDTEVIPANGTITISGNHTLNVTATAFDPIYAIVVTVTEGVNAVPVTGTYNYKTGHKINYSFSLKDGYFGLAVLLDGVAVANQGSFVVSKDHNLNAFATKNYNILTEWTISEKYDDGSAFSVTLKFNGDMKSGTVSDSDGGTGTYSVQGNKVSFNLIYPNVSYEYIGNLTDDNNMSGTAKKLKSVANFVNGTWTATKKTTTTQTVLNKTGTSKSRY